MNPISAATLGGAVAPATIHGGMGGAIIHGALGAATLDGSIGPASLCGKLGGAGLSGAVELATGISEYTGPYEVTPTRETQVLGTAGRRMASDVTIAPIPQNYGLITWNGATLTVS